LQGQNNRRRVRAPSPGGPGWEGGGGQRALRPHLFQSRQVSQGVCRAHASIGVHTRLSVFFRAREGRVWPSGPTPPRPPPPADAPFFYAPAPRTHAAQACGLRRGACSAGRFMCTAADEMAWRRACARCGRHVRVLPQPNRQGAAVNPNRKGSKATLSRVALSLGLDQAG